MKAQQGTAILLGLIGVLLYSFVVARAAPQPIQAGAEEWVVVADVPPFVLQTASVRSGGGGLDERWFGEHPGNGAGHARYDDPSRYMLIGVSIDLEARTHYLDYFMEAPYRDDHTGELHQPELSLVTLFGKQVLLWCYEPPECKERVYSWRSASDLVVSANAYCLMNDEEGRQVRIVCPEPTEILEAYLLRYPSSLSESWSELSSDERAREHVRTAVALELAAAKYWLALVDRDGVESPRAHPVSQVDHHLRQFAIMRQLLKSDVPDPVETERRVGKSRDRPLAERLATLQTIAAEFQQWWDQNVGTPIHVPELPPPPTPASTPPAPTTPPTPAP